MSTNATAYRVSLGGAAVVLILTAGLHGTGYPSVSRMVENANLPTQWVPAFKGLWLMFAIHLVLFACLLAVLALKPAGRTLVAVAGLLPVADTILLLACVGIFPGSIMLGVSAVLVFLALALHPRSEPTAARDTANDRPVR